VRYRERPDLTYRAGPLSLALSLALLAACRPPSGVGPVGRPAGAGAAALERLPAGAAPALSVALRGERDDLLEALDRSFAWFERESSRDYFPVGAVTHERAWASVYAFRELVREVADPVELERRIRREFDFYSSRGNDGRGTVLFTGYYSPTFAGSRGRSDEYRYPLYRLPDDLVTDPATGEVKGRRAEGRIVPYPTRAEIEESRMLQGYELAWLRNPFDVYLIHVQGSAALTLRDGSIMRVGYAGNNGHEYVSIALELVADGKIREDELSLEEVRAYFETHPQDVDRYLRRNPRFVFFREEDGSSWPLGSLGVKVTPLRSLATDKELFPPGGVTLVVTGLPDAAGRARRFERFMLDQDSGGAIRSPGRADIFFGIGLEAERRAGGQYAEGRLYYLFLKPGRVGIWRERGGLGS
jgi:membrane-bound lytic murein transglycosylase A